MFGKLLKIAALSFALSACGGDDPDAAQVDGEGVAVPEPETVTQPEAEEPQAIAGVDADGNVIPRQNRPAIFPARTDTITVDAVRNAKRRALFGDLHIHTRYSFDAYAFGTIATPSDAYRYAKGQAIKHPTGFEMQLKAPLDFLGVTDHAMFLGAVPAAADTTTDFSQYDFAEPFHDLNRSSNRTVDSVSDRRARFTGFIPEVVRRVTGGELEVSVLENIARSGWRDIIDAAELHNQPGEFTSFVAYEYTSSTDERGNLHRNVVFRGADELPDLPFSRFHSQNPEGLWRWMDALREKGIDSVAIPHNSNGSNGAMFMVTDWAGNPIDSEYAKLRMRNEPLVEVTQVKGTSETHPALSPNDEWANFEIMPYRIATTLDSEPSGSYVREAYLRGLALEADTGANPYKFGLVGASDTHTAAGSFDEDNFFAKIGVLDSTAELRGSVPFADAEDADDYPQQGVKAVNGKLYREGATQTWSASGLAAVWAEENTRDAIFDAFRRKETFATSGPRLQIRLFAGYGLDENLVASDDWVKQAYERGVAMGADLKRAGDEAPQVVVWGARDALSAPLQRLQIVKGALVDGEMRETVFDVACSDGLAVDPETHRCPDNGAMVSLDDCSFSQDKGDAELAAVWTDPSFNPEERAFYYARVLENPTCRWSTWDAVREGVPPRPDLQATIQERAWSSPVWFVP